MLETTSTFTILRLLALVLILQQLSPALTWMPDVRPDLQPKQDKIIAKLMGNNTDYYKVLDYNDETILVGARDVVYNISLKSLREINRLEWLSSDADRELCALKGKNEADCHNYIRVFARLDDGKILLCGTNSYKPRCRHYALTQDDTASDNDATTIPSPPLYEVVREVEAQGLCPYSPSHNSTYAFADNQLYSATVADFSGSDPLIYRENLRTEQYDLKQLNQPDFVGAIERDNYVMFFFREISMEHMNYDKKIYSRVARVCKNDRGGPYTLAKSWTSFLKARLNCSIPGEFPFYFEEIQAISPIIESGSRHLVYAVFTTPINAISGSAVCAFDVNDLFDAFEGRFKSQKDSQSQWLPVQDEQVPEPRPGKCVEDSRTLSSIAVNFVKNHPLMEKAVSAIYGRPLLTKVDLHHRLTTIAIDPQIVSLSGESYDVIYTGTDDGKITKFINIPIPGTNKLNTIVISEMQVLPIGVPLRDLIVSSKTNTLLVVSDGSLVTVPLHHCSHIVDCMGCLGLQDPNCAWDQQNHECKSLVGNNNKFGTKFYLQSLNTTKKAAIAICPKTLRGTITADGGVLNNGIAAVSIDLHTSQLTQTDEELSKKLHYANINNAGVVSTVLTNTNAGHVDVGASQTVNDDAEVGATGVGNDFLANSFNDDKIISHSVDPDNLMNTINGDAASILGSTKNLQKSYANLFVTPFIVVIVFLFGIIFGHIISKRICKNESFNASHRNQFNTNSQFGLNHHKSGKDINLLKKPHAFCNQKAQLDLEKDRSHECKNSTENLEKELPCKTSTLTKVKRTYI